MELTQERLRAALDYDPLTGVFLWRTNRRGHAKAGNVAGTPSKGYVSIKLSQKRYYAHRLAWFWMTGKWPAEEIDHRDLDRGNNRWANLREATARQNKGNLRPRTGGLKGVRYEPRGSAWVARIKDHGRNLHLGTFRTATEADAAYRAAAAEIFGEFARTA